MLLHTSLSPFYLLPSSSYLCFKFYFFSCYNLFLFCTLTIAPPYSLSKPFFLSLVILHSFSQLKYPYSLSTFIKLSLLVLVKVVVIAFFNFISRSSLFLPFKSQILPYPSIVPLCLSPALFFPF